MESPRFTPTPYFILSSQSRGVLFSPCQEAKMNTKGIKFRDQSARTFHN